MRQGSDQRGIYKQPIKLFRNKTRRLLVSSSVASTQITEIEQARLRETVLELIHGGVSIANIWTRVLVVIYDLV